MAWTTALLVALGTLWMALSPAWAQKQNCRPTYDINGRLIRWVCR